MTRYWKPRPSGLWTPKGGQGGAIVAPGGILDPGDLPTIISLRPETLGFSNAGDGDGTMSGLPAGVGYYGRVPFPLLAVGGASPNKYLQTKFETGCTPGYTGDINQSPVHHVGYTFGDATFNTYNAGEYRRWYDVRYMTIVGGGDGKFETVTGPGWKTNYWGTTNKNRIDQQGPTSVYLVAVPINPTSDQPARASQFRLDFYTQNGSNYGPVAPNVNPTKYLNVDQEHQVEALLDAGDAGIANGKFRLAIDRELVFDLADVPFRSTSFAQSGSTGTVMIWGVSFEMIWGGFGLYAKTRDEYVRMRSYDAKAA